VGARRGDARWHHACTARRHDRTREEPRRRGRPAVDEHGDGPGRRRGVLRPDPGRGAARRRVRLVAAGRRRPGRRRGGGARAAECAGILAIPWPFIYIGSGAWVAAVRQLRDALPTFVDLEPVARSRAAAEATGVRRAAAAGRWEALSETQRRALGELGLSAERLANL
jgi:hypothetical protein